MMWRSTDREHPDIVAEAFYDSDTCEYVVVVRRGTVQREQRFRASYNPKYGVDYSDFVEIKNVATKLADELTELGEQHKEERDGTT